MVGRQRDNLIDPGIEERFICEKQGANSLLDKVSEGGVEFTCGARIERAQLQPQHLHRPLQVSRLGLGGKAVGWIDGNAGHSVTRPGAWP
jgi:hypothetical protein